MVGDIALGTALARIESLPAMKNRPVVDLSMLSGR
jgi:hypothetical protein